MNVHVGRQHAGNDEFPCCGARFIIPAGKNVTCSEGEVGGAKDGSQRNNENRAQQSRGPASLPLRHDVESEGKMVHFQD